MKSSVCVLILLIGLNYGLSAQKIAGVSPTIEVNLSNTINVISALSSPISLKIHSTRVLSSIGYLRQRNNEELTTKIKIQRKIEAISKPKTLNITKKE